MRIFRIGNLSIEWNGVSKWYMKKMIIKNTVPFVSKDGIHLNRIPAIKWHRNYILECTGRTPSLKESKLYVDMILAKNNIKWTI